MTSLSRSLRGFLFGTFKKLREPVRQNSVHIHPASIFTESQAHFITIDHQTKLLSILNGPQNWSTNQTACEKGTGRTFTAWPNMRKLFNILFFVAGKTMAKKGKSVYQKKKKKTKKRNDTSFVGLGPCYLLASVPQMSPCVGDFFDFMGFSHRETTSKDSIRCVTKFFYL